MCSQRYRISAWCFQTRHGGTDCIPNHREDSGGRTLIQWEFQDPKMEVLYHIRPYFVGIFPYIGLTLALYMVGTSGLGSWNGHWLIVGGLIASARGGPNFQSGRRKFSERWIYWSSASSMTPVWPSMFSSYPDSHVFLRSDKGFNMKNIFQQEAVIMGKAASTGCAEKTGWVCVVVVPYTSQSVLGYMSMFVCKFMSKNTDRDSWWLMFSVSVPVGNHMILFIYIYICIRCWKAWVSTDHF